MISENDGNHRPFYHILSHFFQDGAESNEPTPTLVPGWMKIAEKKAKLEENNNTGNLLIIIDDPFYMFEGSYHN